MPPNWPTGWLRVFGGTKWPIHRPNHRKPSRATASAFYVTNPPCPSTNNGTLQTADLALGHGNGVGGLSHPYSAGQTVY